MTPTAACTQGFAFPEHSSGNVATDSDHALISVQLVLKDTSN